MPIRFRLEPAIRLPLFAIAVAGGCAAYPPAAPLPAPAVTAPGVVHAREPVADLVIHGATIADVVAGEMLPNREIVIQGQMIVSVRPQTADSTRGRREIDGSRFVVLPGFVNTHTHLWQHLAKGFHPSGQLQEWTSIYRNAHYLTDEDVYRVTLAAADEALLSGITTVLDFASVNFSDEALPATVRALREARLGGAIVWWHPAAFLPPVEREHTIRSLQSLGEGKVDVWMGFGPLSFYSIPAVYDGIRTARAMGLRMTEHTMENAREQRDFLSRTSRYLADNDWVMLSDDRRVLRGIKDAGAPPAPDALAALGVNAREVLLAYGDSLSPETMGLLDRLARLDYASPVPLLDHLGALQDFVAIHAVWPTPRDVALFRARNVYVSYNPESNMYLASGVAPVTAYLREGVGGDPRDGRRRQQRRDRHVLGYARGG